MIVEDNPDSLDSMRRLLQLEGHEVATASNAEDGLRAFASFEPEIVLCDLGLGGTMDGYGIASTIRQGVRGAEPYLIALTGYGQPSDIERSRAAGFDRHLVKPADPDALCRLIQELPRSRPG